MSLSPRYARKALSPKGSASKVVASPRSVSGKVGGGKPPPKVIQKELRKGGALRTFTITGNRFYEVRAGKKHSIPKKDLEKLIGKDGIEKVEAADGENVQIDVGGTVPITTEEKKKIPVSPKKGKSPPRTKSPPRVQKVEEKTAEVKGACRPRLSTLKKPLPGLDMDIQVYVEGSCCPGVTNLLGKVLYENHQLAIASGRIPLLLNYEPISNAVRIADKVGLGEVLTALPGVGDMLKWDKNPRKFVKPKKDEIVGFRDDKQYVFGVIVEDTIPGKEDAVVVQYNRVDEEKVKVVSMNSWKILALFQ